MEASPSHKVINVSNPRGSNFLSQNMSNYPQQTLSPPLPTQQSSQPHPELPPQYMPTHQQQALSPPSPRRQSSQPRPMGSILPPQTPSQPSPPQQPSQPHPIAPRRSIASIEKLLGALNNTISQTNREREAKKREINALEAKEKSLARPTFLNKHGELTRHINRLKNKLDADSASRRRLLAELQWARAHNV